MSPTVGFAFTFTVEQVAALLPTNKQPSEWFKALSDNLPLFNINTEARVAAFMAQCSHESIDFTHLHENLNYKAASLIAVWPKHFNASNADSYARKPEKIANRAYRNRMGNGDEASGDGWKYRGRGIIQITGLDNYRACSNFLYQDDRLLDTPDLLEMDFDVAVKSACWYWSTHNLNSFADVGDILTMTKKINGGTIGLDDRIAKYNKDLSILQKK